MIRISLYIAIPKSHKQVYGDLFSLLLFEQRSKRERCYIHKTIKERKGVNLLILEP